MSLWSWRSSTISFLVATIPQIVPALTIAFSFMLAAVSFQCLPTCLGGMTLAFWYLKMLKALGSYNGKNRNYFCTNLIFSYLALESTISPRCCDSFCWRVVFRNPQMGGRCAYCYQDLLSTLNKQSYGNRYMCV